MSQGPFVSDIIRRTGPPYHHSFADLIHCDRSCIPTRHTTCPESPDHAAEAAKAPRSFHSRTVLFYAKKNLTDDSFCTPVSGRPRGAVRLSHAGSLFTTAAPPPHACVDLYNRQRSKRNQGAKESKSKDSKPRKIIVAADQCTEQLHWSSGVEIAE